MSELNEDEVVCKFLDEAAKAVCAELLPLLITPERKWFTLNIKEKADE